MPIIPEAVFGMVESRARDRWMLVERAQQRLDAARDRAARIGAPRTDRAPAGKGGSRAKLPRYAVAVIEAERALEAAVKWAKVFDEMDKRFPHDSPEGETALLLFGSGYSIADCCRALHVDRQTVRRRRETWVVNAALLAAAAGLIEEARP